MYMWPIERALNSIPTDGIETDYSSFRLPRHHLNHEVSEQTKRIDMRELTTNGSRMREEYGIAIAH